MLNNDRKITISAANNRRATYWPQQVLYWSEFVDRLRTPARGSETLAQYLALPKSKQDDLKDIGGFVAGSLTNGRRKPNAVTGRDVLTLDLDNIQPGGTADTIRRIEGLGCSYAVYSTRKHEEAKPRLRVLVPLNRPATADEYEPLARKLASIIGIELCDPTTFQVSRLMYWPSCCLDSQYVFTYGDKGFLDADGLLATYADWRNVAEWPEVPGVQVHTPKAAKQADPTAKEGVVGAFCKIYNIYQAIDQFLPGIYAPCDDNPERFTFTGGSTTGGAVIYDSGTFLFSHHATDPAGGKLVNSFDLVRLHLYSEKDDEAKPDTPTNKLPSFMAMCQLAVSDQAVASLLNQERYEKATTDFNTPIPATSLPGTPIPGMPSSPVAVNDINWMSKLSMSPNSGLPAKTVDNCLIILDNDPLLKGKIAYDEFANQGIVLGALPWNRKENRREWSDLDDAGLRHYLEKVYAITGKDRISDATALIAYKHSFNPLLDSLNSQQWDGIPRLDTLFTDYLGAVNNEYTRAVSRKSLCAAVARAMSPGIKYDYMPIFTGPEGIGKSTFLRILGSPWFSESLQTFEGKEAAEMLRGVWINEMPELQGFNKTEVTAIKQFLSRTEDLYREPFGRHTKKFPRSCVFFGTTNESEFLKGINGDRRFWPVDTAILPPIKNVFTDLENEVHQIWAEAVHYWGLGEALFLPEKVSLLAKEQQNLHRETSAKEGLIREFVERQIPINWDKRSQGDRRLYWSSEFGQAATDKVETTVRYKICAAEIWVECLGGDIKFMRRVDAIEINTVLSTIPGWVKHNEAYRFGPYGPQKGFLKL